MAASRMFRWLTALAALAVIAGCGAQSGEDSGGSSGKGGAPITSPPGQKGSKISADQLTEALLTEFDDLVWAVDPQAGEYGSLPVAPYDSLDPKNIPSSVTFEPDNCRGVMWAGPELEAFRTSPTAFVQFADPEAVKSGKDSVVAWNILIATAGQPKEAAIGRPDPACPTVTSTKQGASMTLEEKSPPKIGNARRAAFLRPSGKNDSRPSWIVSYIGDGYVGMVLLQGPTDQSQVMNFAKQTFKKAQRTLE